MSKGNKVVTLRIEEPILMEMNALIRNRNDRTKEAPWDRTAFIVTAIIEKIKHMERSRRSKRKKIMELPKPHAERGSVLHPDASEDEILSAAIDNLDRDESEAIDG